MQKSFWKTVINIKNNNSKFVRIGRSELGNYTIISNNDESFATLADFLISEICNPHAYAYFMNWLRGQCAQNWAVSNAFELIEEGDEIVMYWVHYTLMTDAEYYKDIPGIVYFKIPKKQLIQIIEQWVDIICQQNQPDNITITQDDTGKVEITLHVD